MGNRSLQCPVLSGDRAQPQEQQPGCLLRSHQQEGRQWGMWRCVSPGSSRQELVRDFPNANPGESSSSWRGETIGQRRGQNMYQMTGNKA